jgi:hypothetical protein
MISRNSRIMWSPNVCVRLIIYAFMRSFEEAYKMDL